MGKTVTSIVSAGLMVAGVIATGGLGTALIVAGIAVQAAGAFIFQDKLPSMQYRDQSERKQMLRSAVAPETIIVGKTVCSGLLFFAEEEKGEQTENERLFLAIAIAAHKVDRIGKIWLNEDLIDTFGDKVSYEFHNGRIDCDPYMLKNAPSWKEDMIGDGLAWLRLTLKYDAEKFPYGVPNVKVEVWGKPLFDPRTNQTVWSNNGALVILDFYRSYLGVPDSDIDFDAFKVAADLCDEPVVSPEGQSEPRYTINGAYELSESPSSILDHMHRCVAAEPTYVAGKHGILMQAYNGPAVLRIEPNQIIDTVNITPELALRDATNAIYGTFVDAEQQYIKTDFEPILIDEWINEDGLEIKEDLDYRFVTSPYQAARLSNLYLRKKRAGRRVQLRMNMDGYAYRPGEVILLNLPHIGIQNMEFRVAEWKFHPQEGVDILLEEDGAYIYEDVIGKPFVRPPFTVLPTGSVAPPLNLTFVPTNIGDVVQGYLSWQSAAADVRYHTVNIIENDQVIQSVQAPHDRVELSGLIRGAYRAEVRSINAAGAMSSPAIVDFDIQAPPQPVSVEMVGGMFSLTCIPHGGETAQHGYTFEFWFSDKKLASTNDTEVTTKANRQGQGQFWTKENLKSDTDYWFYVRTVNSYGKSLFVEVVGKAEGTPKDMLDEVGNNFLSKEAGKEMQKDIDFSRDKVDALEIEQQETSQKVIDIDSKTVELDNRVVQINTDVGIANEAILQNTLFTTQLSYKISEEKADRKAEIIELKQVQVTDREAAALRQMQTSAVIASNTSSILAVQEAQATYEEASAKQINQVKADVEGVTGRVTEVESATATLTEAQAKFERSTVAQFEEHMGYITRIETTVSNDLFSLSESVMQTAAQFASQSDKQLKSEARITKNEKAVATETEARAVMGVQIDARLNDTESAITDIKEVQSEQDKALAKTTEQLRAEIKIGDDKLQENIDEKGRELSKVSSSIDEQKIAIAELDKTQTEIKQTQQSQYKDTQASIADLKQTQASDNAVLSESILQNTASINQQGAELTKTNAEVKRISTATANNEKSTAALAESVKTQFEDSEAAFVDVRKSVAEVDKAQSERTEQVRAELGKGITDNKGEIDKTKGDLANVSAAVTSNAKAIAATDKTLTEKIEQAASRFEDNEASISNIQQSQSNIESSQAETSMQITAQQNKLNSELLHAKASITETNKVVADNHQAFVQKGVQLDAQFENVNSRLVRVDTAIADNEKALTQTQEQLRAEFKSDFDDTNSLINENKSAIAETNKSIAKVDRDLNARVGKAEGSIGETQKAVADNERALADFSQLTKAEFDNQQAAIEQRAQTVFDHQGNGSAIYKIQAGIHWNGQYHDAKFIIGAEVKNGQVTTQIGFSADTFGILNPSSGKLEPVFFVENGQVFINEAFINQATIEKLLIGSTIKSKHWDPVTKKGLMLDFESGKIIASDAEITGEINATSGTFSNVTIDENCDVKGTIYANKIVGDVIRVHSIPFDGSITLPAEAFDRTLVIPALTVSTMESSDFSNVNWHVEVKINDRIIISFSPLSSVTGSRSAGGDNYDVYAITSGSTSGAGVLYANETATISYKIVGHVSSYHLIHKIPAQCLVFKS
ncbi:phage tail tip protein J-related protein [Moellerella wisconsensis]|uniref:DUF1983 domain-containing protein n=1 Tax=Moellerella wisconsensis TaxID=158849 RepID=A0ACD3YE03_9GAMM|nr:DUF1983 domain-containing protein [Moellerella wisconsensis]UNH40211.1 DUF1983 domain-containing protein [Moellerella wisconsensis]